MTNLAVDNVSPIRPDLRAVEQRVADLDDGYAKLSNMLLEEYAGADLTKRQFKVLLAVLRKTYGWNKPMDRITDSQISEIAKLPVKRCNEAKLELVRMGLLRQQGGMFGPNKNVTEWRFPQSRGASPKTGDKISLKLRDKPPSKQGDTKDTITKDNKYIKPPVSPRGENSRFDPLSIPIPDFLNPNSWNEWVEYRQQSGKPIKTQVTVTKAFKLLRECYDEGHDPAAVIDSSIANGYQGLFKPKGRPSSPPVNQQPEHHWNSPESWEEFI